MTRILVQRGLAGSSSSSNQNRSSASSPSSSSTSPQHQGTGTAQVVPAVKDEDSVEVQELDELSDNCAVSENKSEDISLGSLQEGEKSVEDETVHNEDNDDEGSGNFVKEVGGLSVMEGETDAMVGSSTQKYPGSSTPPPPPVPPPKPSFGNLISRIPTSSDQNLLRTGPSGRASVLPGVRIWSSPTRPCPSSPRSHFDVEGYNSADEQNACFSSSYTNAEREHQFEIDIRRAKGLELRKMLEDGNCLFRGVADQVYGDSELYDLVRQMCIDYMERERDHFSQFITEGFTSYCKRKRRDKVYGNNVEIQALSEMYNRPIHIYSYSPEPINIFHGNYHTDPPIRLSYHHGNHYNSLVDPRRPTVGAGLGFSSLHGTSIDKEKVKAAIKAQQDQHIDNALLAEGRFFSDLELTEKEIERMVMETSRAEYLANDKFMQHPSPKESSTSSAEPSSSATRTDAQGLGYSGGSVLSDSMQVMLSMGFSYLQVVEACSIFGDDVDSMACYLIETSSSARNKGKATEK